MRSSWVRRTPALALAVVAGLLTTVAPLPTGLSPSGAPGRGLATPVAAASDTSGPWTSPTMPPRCTDAQKASGDVGACLFDGSGSPSARGWATPPFPTPLVTAPTAWVPIQRGDVGARVTTLQQALVAAGVPVPVDGVFGPVTEAAVVQYQTGAALPATGVVDEVTADALGILATAAPGTFPPPGWNWLGWGYNRSPALADWETRLVSNPAAIGRVSARQLTSMPEAFPLFEGFVRDIVAGGYRITDLGSYVFRCTSNSRKTCEGLTASSLSNHSWGLAIDLNTAANPELTYRATDGGTACAVPMQTDIPQWVVRAAERWGLYWGGYGWGGGCATPQTQRSSVLRDTMHFEFRGTPAQAATITAFNRTGTPVTPPTRTCLTVADDAGATSTRCLTPAEQPRGGWRTVVTTGAPAGATAAVVNITLADATAAGFVTAEPCSATSGPRGSSNGNATPGVVSANLSVVPIDSTGSFCLYQSQPMDTVVDVQGFFVPGGGGNVLHVVRPTRLVDTRVDAFCAAGGSCGRSGPVAGGTEMSVSTGLVPTSAVAMLANLTVTGPAAAGYVTADACSSLVPGPQTRSNTNFLAGATVANLAVVPTGSGTGSGTGGAQICTYTSATAQKVIDVQGYFAPASTGGWGYDPQPATRLVDTRGGSRPDAGTVVRVQAPAGAAAALVNLTLTDARTAGYVTADACSALVPGPQTKSNGNSTVGRITANVAVVPLDPDGSFCVYLSHATHLVVDLQGSFSPTGSLRFVPVTPVRRHDSRELNTA